MRNHHLRALRAVVCGGLGAGTLDIFIAAWIGRVSPLVVMQAIASGLLGSAALRGGASAAALGFLSQWILSLIIAAVYVLSAQRIRLLVRYWFVTGIAYGVVIFFVMNYVVMPLSAAPFGPHFTARSFVLNLLAMLLFGLIVAGFAQLFLGRRRDDARVQTPLSSKTS
ncbi:MAG TPA: hypothetical protein VFX38_00485 [Gammaproteobacteria bacterium]|nr:hypothetical protein [Gammaproteobacteria bacterium]